MQGQITPKKRLKGLSIFYRFFISYLGVGSIICIVLGGGFYLREQKVIKEELKSQFSNALKNSITYFDNTYVSRGREDLSFIEKSYAFNSFLSSQKDEAILTKSLAEQLFLHFTNRTKGIYLSARFIDSRGIERVVTSGNKILRNYTSLDSFPSTNILYSKIYTLFKRLKPEKVGTILFEGPFKYGDKFTFVVGISKSDPEVGGFAGAVIFHCDLTDYFNYLDGHVFYKEHVAKAFALDDELIFAPGQNTLSLQHPNLLKKESFYSVSDTVKMGSDNRALLKVVFSMSRDIFRAQLRSTFINLILYIYAIMILVAILAFVMSKQLSTPLAGLIVSADLLAKGDLSVRANIKAKGEMGLLVESFNNMAEDLQEKTVSRDTLIQEVAERKKAEEEVRQFKTISDRASYGTAIANTKGNLIYINEAFARMHGYAPYHLIGKNLSMLYSEEQMKNADKLIETMEKKDDFTAEEMWHKKKDGTLFPILMNITVIKDEKEVALFLSLTAVDITERKKVEAEREALIKELELRQELLKKQRQELEDSRRAIKNVAADLKESKEILEYQKQSLEDVNKELNDFTYIVSHDLKEPLRSIDAYAKFIVDDYHDKFGEEGKHDIERIRANTERMKKLIDDLLELSRLKRRGSTIEEVETEELIGEVKMRLEYAIKQKGVEIVIKNKLPKIFCDRVRLTEVFLNLISNAIKFDDKQKPIIEIGCNDKGGFYEFYVKDNGIGIKEEYFDKIFEIFQRLGKREDVEGTGAGLTIAKKIVQMHRGKIWLESKTGEGSTFYFTIPKEKSIIVGKKLIGEILIEKKLLTEEDMKKALEEQQRIGRVNEGGQNGGIA